MESELARSTGVDSNEMRSLYSDIAYYLVVWRVN